jgi:hypothetical protein
MAFMLRLWQVKCGEASTWRATVESPHTGERRAFADLEGLLDFLRDSTEGESEEESGVKTVGAQDQAQTTT